MGTEFKLKLPQDAWRAEFAKYVDRVSALEILTPDLLEQIKKQPTNIDFTPTPATSARARSLYLANDTLTSSHEIVTSFLVLWGHGHLLAAAHCVRLLQELWALQIYLQVKVLEKAALGDVEAKKANEKLQRLNARHKHCSPTSCWP